MKLLNSFGPNPRLVRMFTLEKGMELETQDFDLMGGENRAAPYLSKNPGGQMPALELDDGSVIAETVAICEYLEDVQPLPVLIGGTAIQDGWLSLPCVHPSSHRSCRSPGSHAQPPLAGLQFPFRASTSFRKSPTMRLYSSGSSCIVRWPLFSKMAIFDPGTRL